jgi:hypothetical protein
MRQGAPLPSGILPQHPPEGLSPALSPGAGLLAARRTESMLRALEESLRASEKHWQYIVDRLKTRSRHDGEKPAPTRAADNAPCGKLNVFASDLRHHSGPVAA